MSVANSLDTTSIPLPVPLPELALFSYDDLRFLVSQLFEMLNQIFPATPSGENELAIFWIHRIVSETGLFYTYLFSQLTRNTCTQILPSRAQRQIVQCHSETVSYVNTQLADPATACNDDNIHAVLALANHYLPEDTSPARVGVQGPAQGPLNSLRLLNLYGGPIQPVSMHWQGLLHMIKLRGGIEKIKLSGLAGQIS